MEQVKYAWEKMHLNVVKVIHIHKFYTILQNYSKENWHTIQFRRHRFHRHQLADSSIFVDQWSMIWQDDLEWIQNFNFSRHKYKLNCPLVIPTLNIWRQKQNICY